jgi:hypothetical protein
MATHGNGNIYTTEYIELSIEQAPDTEPTRNNGRTPLMNLQRNIEHIWVVLKVWTNM